MAEMIQRFVQDFFLSVLGLIGGACAICGIVAITRRFLVRVKSVGLALLFSVAVAAAVMFGGAKTNELLQAFFPFVPQVQQIPLMPTSLSTNGVPVIAATSPRASATMPFRAEKWNVRGAWNDSFRYAFDDGWEFPFGTGHLDRVEVCSQGRVIPRYGSTDVIASVGVPLEVVNPTTSFGCGSTDRNSYIFSWTNAVVGRVLHEEVASAETIDASIELFRNGDVGITTNGVTELIPRVLPFPHDGFGQDEEWIAANFTNATEILAVGYPQWVDAQVGENLTNGLYKFTVTIPDVPPETIQLVVGDYSVAVTNSGDYVFLLEKGAYYEVDFSYLPYGVAYAWSDGMEDALPPSMPLRGAINSPAYTVRLVSTGDGGHDAEFTAPAQGVGGRIVWRPWLSIAPDDVTDPAFPVLLSADVFDIPEGRGASVTWEANGNVLATGENFLWDSNEDDIDVINVTATIHDVVLHGVVRVVRHVRTSGISISGGGLIIVEDAYTNAPGEVVSASSTTTGVHLAWSLAEAGQLKLEADLADGVAVYEDYGDGIELPVSQVLTWDADSDEEGTRDLTVCCTNVQGSGTVGTFTFTFTPDDDGAALTNTLSIQIVKIKVEADADWPSNKVRHVFGPLETARLTVTPQVTGLHFEGDACFHSTTTNGQYALCFTNHAMASSVRVVLDTGQQLELNFEVVAPECTTSSLPVELSEEEWQPLLDMRPLQPNEPGIAWKSEVRLLPDYVSFKHLRVAELDIPATQIWGCCTNDYFFPTQEIAHVGTSIPIEDGGPGASVGVGNKIGDNDYVAFWPASYFPLPCNPGGFTLDIPVVWYTEDRSYTNQLPNASQVMLIHSNGTVRASKHGYTFERAIGGSFYRVN